VITSLIAGLVLGLSAGMSPGPLSVLLISQTLRHGIREGVKVALAPFITDVPIIALTMFVFTRLASSQTLLGLISIAGGMFLLYLAYESFRTSGVELSAQAGAPQSLSRGALVNLFNPNPYVFWLTVGAPTMLKAWGETPFAAIAFVVGFYFCLVGSKILLAVVVGKTRSLFTGRPYIYLMRALGVLLVIYALVLFRDGLQLLGIFSL
jgi:threonine/homoserine/homoserine lactone efflux protein